jgi:hypothetical protein
VGIKIILGQSLVLMNGTPCYRRGFCRIAGPEFQTEGRLYTIHINLELKRAASFESLAEGTAVNAGEVGMLATASLDCPLSWM